MAVLHIVSSPHALASCLRAMGDDDRLLLTGDGVYAMSDLPARTAAAVLGDHLAARGVEPPEGVTRIDHAAFVALVVDCETSVSWS